MVPQQRYCVRLIVDEAGLKPVAAATPNGFVLAHAEVRRLKQTGTNIQGIVRTSLAVCPLAIPDAFHPDLHRLRNLGGRTGAATRVRPSYGIGRQVHRRRSRNGERNAPTPRHPCLAVRLSNNRYLVYGYPLGTGPTSLAQVLNCRYGCTQRRNQQRNIKSSPGCRSLYAQRRRPSTERRQRNC